LLQLQVTEKSIKLLLKLLSIMLKKTFQFITVCKGDMNHRKPKTAKIILGLNLGLYHHVLIPVALPRWAVLNRLFVKRGSSMHVSASGNYSSPAFIGDLAFIIALASNSQSLP